MMTTGLASVWLVVSMMAQFGPIEKTPADGIAHPAQSVSVDDVSWLLKPADQVNANRRIMDRLKQRVVWSCDDLSLRDAYQSLAKQLGCECDFDLETLTGEGVSLDQKVSVASFHRTGLAHLDKLSKRTELAWIIEDDHLLITSLSHAEELMETRIFPVDDLLPPADPLPPGANPSPDRKRYEQLQDFIFENTSAKWEGQDGEGGSLAPFRLGEGLMIRHTARVQQEIAELLEQLRIVKGLPSASILVAQRRRQAAEATSRGSTITRPTAPQ